jgi:hypothetical protein
MDEFIIESDMRFIADNAFHIEKSQVYRNIGKGIRSVEFIRVLDNDLLFVEAKTTFPNPNNDKNSYQSAIDEICEKFIHSLNLVSSLYVRVAIDPLFAKITLQDKTSLIFVLIIANHQLCWCRFVKRSIETALPFYLRKIWKPTIYVINKEIAIHHKLAENL